MTRYYYVDANRQKAGPISPEEFHNIGISEQTLVWTKGMTNWTKAGHIPELAEFYANIEKEVTESDEESSVLESTVEKNIRPLQYY